MRHPLTLLCPYPTIESDTDLRDGFALEQAHFCTDKCKNRTCVTMEAPKDNEPLRYFTCPAGYSVITTKIHGEIIRINGVVETISNEGNPDFKKRNKAQKIKDVELRGWIKSINEIAPAFDAYAKETAINAIHGFHEIKALIGTVLTTTEKWVYSHPGESIEEKLSNASPQLATIYHSCRVLISLLQMTDIIANSEAATYGQPAPSSIHGIFFMLQKVFDERARSRKLHIRLEGKSFNRPAVYRSFLILPLVLVDNAVKYSDPGHDILISIDDGPQSSVSVQVHSYGKLIPIDQQKSVFQRGIRGSNTHMPGTGMGLHVARTVAEANDIRLRYESKPVSADLQYGWNNFAFDVTGVVK